MGDVDLLIDSDDSTCEPNRCWRVDRIGYAESFFTPWRHRVLSQRVCGLVGFGETSRENLSRDRTAQPEHGALRASRGHHGAGIATAPACGELKRHHTHGSALIETICFCRAAGNMRPGTRLSRCRTIALFAGCMSRSVDWEELISAPQSGVSWWAIFRRCADSIVLSRSHPSGLSSRLNFNSGRKLSRGCAGTRHPPDTTRLPSSRASNPRKFAFRPFLGIREWSDRRATQHAVCDEQDRATIRKALAELNHAEEAQPILG